MIVDEPMNNYVKSILRFVGKIWRARKGRLSLVGDWM